MNCRNNFERIVVLLRRQINCWTESERREPVEVNRRQRGKQGEKLIIMQQYEINCEIEDANCECRCVSVVG